MFLFLCTFVLPLICVLVKIAVAVFLVHLRNAWLPPLQIAMRFLACGFFICVLLCCICAYVFVNRFYHALLFTLLTNYLHYLSALFDAQFIPAYLIYKLNASSKICLSVFRNGKLLQLLTLVNLLFSHTEYLAENGKHTSSLASCVYYISFLTYITKNECN